jgi:hypothetical protein
MIYIVCMNKSYESWIKFNDGDRIFSHVISPFLILIVSKSQRIKNHLIRERERERERGHKITTT